MGTYRQHLAVSTATGLVIAWGAWLAAGIHWVYGSVAALVTAVGGLLPDLDHPIGVEIKGLTGLLGVVAAMAVWDYAEVRLPNVSFEVVIWAVVLTYFTVRYGLRRASAFAMVHRGISHSVPACLAWGCLAYLYYPSVYHPLRVLVAVAVMAGFLSHLVLDEICSFDLVGHRVKSSFGTALKFWARSAGSTLVIYVVLFLLVRQVIEIWPAGPALQSLSERVPPPRFPRLTDMHPPRPVRIRDDEPREVDAFWQFARPVRPDWRSQIRGNPYNR